MRNSGYATPTTSPQRERQDYRTRVPQVGSCGATEAALAPPPAPAPVSQTRQPTRPSDMTSRAIRELIGTTVVDVDALPFCAAS